MADLSDELVDAARRILAMVDGESLDHSDDVPAPPSADETLKDKLTEAQYQGNLAAAAARRKAAVDRASAERDVVVKREDAETAAEVDRQKVERAVETDAAKVERAAEIARVVATRATLESRIDADRAAEAAEVKAVHDAYLTVAQGAIDRAMKRAEFLTTAVTAITGVYTGVLGLAFGLGTGNTVLPGRGLIPVVFLALTIVLAAVYMAYIRDYARRRVLLPTGSGGELAQQRLVTFFDWTFAAVLRRAWALRLSVVSMGIGIALLPLPFVDVAGRALQWVVGVACALFVIAVIGELALWLIRRGRIRNPHDVPGG